VLPGAEGREATVAEEIFTDAWARIWHAKINGSAVFREASQTWEGAIVLEMTADPSWGIPEDRSVVADLWHGESRGAHAVGPEDIERARFVISAKPAIWSKVLAKHYGPIVAISMGRLRLTKGKLSGLVPYTKAARELVNAATRVETSFPPGWE
jgi:putative sterol carrier protein